MGNRLAVHPLAGVTKQAGTGRLAVSSIVAKTFMPSSGPPQRSLGRHLQSEVRPLCALLPGHQC